MSKSKKNDNQFERSIELGKKSKRLVPRIKNWCSNIEIHSEYGGIMGQMGYPTMNTISCSQARGGGAMNLEWIAYDFIVENCPGCKYHKEITPNNFGRETLENYEKIIFKQKEQQKKEKAIISNLETLIQQKISNKHEKSNTPELSVLRKLLKLTNPKTKHSVISLELLEASKISPSFFNSLSNDYLSVFFDNNQFGNHLLEASFNVIEYNEDVISDFFIEKVINLLEKEDNLNNLIRVLPISRLNQSKAHHVCKTIISRYDTNSFNRYDYFENHSPALLQFIYFFHDEYNTQLFEILEDNLKDNNGQLRAFTSLIICHLIDNDKNLKFTIIDKMILSLDLDDYENHLSPDYIITKTIARIYQKFPNEVLGAIKRIKNRLKTEGNIELIRVYEDVLEKQKESKENTFLDELIAISLSPREPDLRKKAIDVLENLSRTNGTLLLDKSDSLIGLLAHSIRNQIKFEWYKKNLDNNTVTFNPLKNQTIDSILLDENLMAYEIDKLKGIAKNLLTINEPQTYESLIAIIRNTNIKNEDEKRLKIRLIEVIRDGVKDSALLIDVLPDIYTWLLDFKNSSLRVGALKLVEKLLKNNRQIVPKTILDLLEIFLKDQDNWVKKHTILCFKQIIRRDKELDDLIINTLLACYNDKYVLIHKTATEITYDLYEKISPKQRLQLLQNLLHLFWAYNEEEELDIEFCKKMFRQVMFVSKEINPKHLELTEPTLIKKYLSDYCINGNYYSRLDSLKDLSKFKNENSEYDETWLRNSLLFLNQFKPHRLQGFWDSDRYTLYKDFPTLNSKTIVNQIDSLKTSTKKAIIRDFDLYSFESLYILSIFSFYNLYDDLNELIQHIEESVDKTKSINYFFDQLTLFKNFTNASIAIHRDANPPKFDAAMKNLKQIDNELLQLQADIFSKRVALFYDFNIIDSERVLLEKEYLLNQYKRLIKISDESEEKNQFIAFSLLCKAVFSFLEWGRAVLDGDSIQQAKLIAAKTNLEMVDRKVFNYLPLLENKVLALIDNINNTSQFNITSFVKIVRSFAKLNIPIIYYLTTENRMFRGSELEEDGKKTEDINLVSIELYLRSVPWANPQIIKPKEVYRIEGKVRINKVPEGYDSLHIVPASTNSEIYDIQLDEIKLNSNSEYLVSGNILFKYPVSDLDQIISIKLVPYYERGGVKMYPSVIGYDELIGRVIDENNELFQTGFDMMNKKVFEFYKNPLIKQLEKSERTDFFRLLNATINYQGFCIQNGVFKKVTKILENEFRDKLIQHLIANPTIGGQIRKEAEIAGGKVEIEYKGFIIELKVEYTLSDRMKMVSKYESQAQSYASGSSMLASIICILDLTEKKLAPSPTINNIYLNQPKTHGFEDTEVTYKPFQIFVFIDGNTNNPSDYSK